MLNPLVTNKTTIISVKYWLRRLKSIKKMLHKSIMFDEFISILYYSFYDSNLTHEMK